MWWEPSYDTATANLQHFADNTNIFTKNFIQMLIPHTLYL